VNPPSPRKGRSTQAELQVKGHQIQRAMKSQTPGPKALKDKPTVPKMPTTTQGRQEIENLHHSLIPRINMGWKKLTNS
jgi:hypothetical protein